MELELSLRCIPQVMLLGNVILTCQRKTKPPWENGPHCLGLCSHPSRSGAEHSQPWFAAGCPSLPADTCLQQLPVLTLGNGALQGNEGWQSESEVAPWVCWEGKTALHLETFTAPAQTLEYVPS